jgi:hypothetical protein
MRLSPRLLIPVVLAASLLPLPAAPAAAAKPAAKPSDDKPVVIEIRPRRPDPAAVARERERRARMERAMPGWCGRYRAAVRPLRAALDETDRSLAMSWGPWSRNVCFALRLELDAFSQRPLPAAPDPAVAADLRRAVVALTEAAGACTRGLPTTTRLALTPGLRDLARVDAACAPAGRE